MRLLPAVSLLALVISTVVALMQGAELATIHSSIQQASALVPDYGSLMAWRVVLLTAALVCWIAPQLKGYSPALPLLSPGLCTGAGRGVNWSRRILWSAYDGRSGYRQLILDFVIKSRDIAPGFSFFIHEIFRLMFRCKNSRK